MNRNPETVTEAADRRKQQLLLLAPDVLQNPHNLPLDKQKERTPKRASRRASPKAKARGRTD